MDRDEKLVKSEQKEVKIRWKKCLSTGIVNLNLACSDRPDVGLVPGHIYVLTGGSQSGKTWLGKQILAEASINPTFDEYELVYNCPEYGDLMSERRYFGDKLARRVRPPSKKGCSTTIEGFYDDFEELCDSGKPFIEVLDSEDALKPESEISRRKKNRKARESGKELVGSMGAERAKANSAGLRGANIGLHKSGSILVIIKQTRQNMGFSARFQTETRSGGLALGFYSSLEFWFKSIGKIKKKVNDIERVIGYNLRIDVKKNRVSGNDCSIQVPFYKKYGFDDIGGMVDYLIAEGRWKESKGIIKADDLELTLRKEKLIQTIQEDELERELILITHQVWEDVQSQCQVKRKFRYV